LEVDLDNINETPDSHIRRLNSYNGSNPGSDHKSIVLNRVSSNGSISSDISFTQSMPGLEYLSDSSTSDDQSFRSLPPSLGGETHKYWNQKHVDVMAEDRNRRLRDWRANEDRAAEAKEKFRQNEMLKGIRNIIAERDIPLTPELLRRPTPIPTILHNITPGSDRINKTIKDAAPINSFETIDPRLVKRREILEGILEGLSTSTILDSPLIPSRLHTNSPINVFSVSIPSPIGSPILRPSAPLIEYLELPEVEDPEPIKEREHIAARPTIVYGADETQMGVVGELAEQVPEYLTGPVIRQSCMPFSSDDALSTNPDYQLIDIPSPTDTEIIDHSMVLDRQQFPCAQPDRRLI